VARTDRERELIERFILAYNVEKNADYTVTEWPDEDSSAQAIDAVAADNDLGTLAIEHTLVQPFENERADSAIFSRCLAPLDHKPALLKPGFDVTLTFKVGAVPKKVDWSVVPKAVEDWYLAAFESLPFGNFNRVVDGLPFECEVNVDKETTTGEPHLFIDRWMPGETIDNVVSTSLAAKVPKLAAAPGNTRVLLLEKNSLPRSPDEIGEAVERNRERFPELERIDEVWVINTVVWPQKDYTPAYFVWPRSLARSWRRFRNLASRRRRLAQ